MFGMALLVLVSATHEDSPVGFRAHYNIYLLIIIIVIIIIIIDNL